MKTTEEQLREMTENALTLYDALRQIVKLIPHNSYNCQLAVKIAEQAMEKTK